MTADPQPITPEEWQEAREHLERVKAALRPPGMTAEEEERLALERGRQAIADYEAEFGAFTPEERAQARAELIELGVIDGSAD
ncbi:MAG: hypothetical protein GXY03_05470 [Solirubrobacterales bacterium]|nr:hypothetical protein [Solirubrobacterales bacterium]